MKPGARAIVSICADGGQGTVALIERGEGPGFRPNSTAPDGIPAKRSKERAEPGSSSSLLEAANRAATSSAVQGDRSCWVSALRRFARLRPG